MVFQVVGQELLADKVAGIVVGIFIVVAVAKLFHQLGGGVAQVQGDGQVACLPHQGEGIVDCHVGGVAFGAGGEVDGGLCQWDASFGPAHFHDGVEAGIGKQQGVGVCQSDVLGSGDDKATGYESGVFTAFHHACQPVDGSVGVAAANGLDEGGDDVVVHFAVFVVGKGILLEAFGHHLIGDDHRVAGFGLHNEVEDVEQLTGIAATVTEHGGSLPELYLPFFQLDIRRYGTLQEFQQVVFLQRFQHVELAARQQRTDHLERGVLGGGAYQCHRTLLHRTEQRVLLRLAETVDFIDEQYGACL